MKYTLFFVVLVLCLQEQNVSAEVKPPQQGASQPNKVAEPAGSKEPASEEKQTLASKEQETTDNKKRDQTQSPSTDIVSEEEQNIDKQLESTKHKTDTTQTENIPQSKQDSDVQKDQGVGQKSDGLKEIKLQDKTNDKVPDQQSNEGLKKSEVKVKVDRNSPDQQKNDGLKESAVDDKVDEKAPVQGNQEAPAVQDHGTPLPKSTVNHDEGKSENVPESEYDSLVELIFLLSCLKKRRCVIH